MSFSIRRTIRDLVAPSHHLSSPRHVWRSVIGELERRGEGHHEAGAFLLGVERNGRREVKRAVFYDELQADAYSTGVCVLDGAAFGQLWEKCRQLGLTVVADAHTHGGVARQSHADRTNPMVARAGHVAIIVPNLARSPVRVSALGVYQYRGQHQWSDWSGRRAGTFFYVGFWS